MAFEEIIMTTLITTRVTLYYAFMYNKAGMKMMLSFTYVRI